MSSSNLQSERGIDSIIDIALAGIPTELNITQELVKEVLTSLPLDLSDPNKNIFGLDIPDDLAANFTNLIEGISNGTIFNITLFQFNTSGVRDEIR